MTEADFPSARWDTAERPGADRPGQLAARPTRGAVGGWACCCAPRAFRNGSPSRLPADTQLKRHVDRFLPRAGLPVVAFFAAAISALNLAPLLSSPAAALGLEGAAALAAGGWCALNFWRCRHAHCLVTGAGWLGLSLLAFAEAGLGHSVIGGSERDVFLVVLVTGFAFEAAWRIIRGTNAMTRSPGSQRVEC